jgi:hypothetical protein
VRRRICTLLRVWPLCNAFNNNRAELSQSFAFFGWKVRSWTEADFGGLTWGSVMLGDAKAMQLIAAKYLELADSAAEPRERERFARYAAVYQQMAGQTEGLPAPRRREAAISSRPSPQAFNGIQ